MSAQAPDVQTGPALELMPAASAADALGGRPGWVRSLDLAIPVAILAFIFGACFLWPLIGSVPPPIGGNILDAGQPIFSSGHVLGTDPVGNDILSRLL
jgi:peptide/nickel transport system permease protein